jgi:2-polyprenyl-3-methyl-5-hydroxy-6-metoxy-1,4-benzoquinol methylase
VASDILKEIKECYHCKKDISYSSLFISPKEMRWNCYGKKKAIVRCSHCDLIQLHPQWSKRDLDKIYSNYSNKKDFKGQKRLSIEYPFYIDKYLKKQHSILEIGCSKGYNIRRLRNKGYNIVGLDKDKSVCDNVTILNYDVSELKTLGKDYDIIYAIHLLEHLSNPVKFINTCYKSLKDKGKLILEIPNIEEPLYTLWKNEEYKKFFWIPDHQFFFDYNMISNLVATTKFDIFKVYRKQRYGLFNHLNWFFRGKPTNINFNIPLFDFLYKLVLIHLFHKSDTLVIVLEKE